MHVKTSALVVLTSVITLASLSTAHASSDALRYATFGAGYNAADEKGVGYVSTGIHLNDHQSVGVHHRQEGNNTSYGVDAQAYKVLPNSSPLLVGVGMSVGRTYHDEIEYEDGNYVGLSAGVLFAPQAMKEGLLFINYTHQFAADENPDIGFSQIGYRFLF